MVHGSGSDFKLITIWLPAVLWALPSSSSLRSTEERPRLPQHRCRVTGTFPPPADDRCQVALPCSLADTNLTNYLTERLSCFPEGLQKAEEAKKRKQPPGGPLPARYPK